MSVEPWILHADMDAFYASVEQRDFPELRGQPVIVGANSARGVVAAASYEARQFGVHSAMPGFQARKLCPQAIYRPARMQVYAEVSAQVRAVFLEFTPLVEPLALDEAFLDVSGSLHLHAGPTELARALKRRVKECTELNVSVGMGPNKLVAKLACTLGKPNGLNVVRRPQVEAMMAPLPIRRLWGVGRVTAGKLQNYGIHTIGQLARYDEHLLRSLLGEAALQLQARARGEDSSRVEPERKPKSIGEENTFHTDVLQRDVVNATLTAHSETVAHRLRKVGYRGRTVTLKIKLGRARREGERDEPAYPVLTRSRTLSAATDDAKLMHQTAMQLWDEARVAEPVRLLGLTMSNLQSATQAHQLDLFGTQQRADRLGPTLDKINARFGKQVIHRAVDDPEKITPHLGKRH